MGILEEVFKDLAVKHTQSMLYYKEMAEDCLKYAEEFKGDPEFIEFYYNRESYFLAYIKRIENIDSWSIKIYGKIIEKDNPKIVNKDRIFNKSKIFEPRVLTEQEYKNRLFEYVTGKE
jgi:hypothetical protein